MSSALGDVADARRRIAVRVEQLAGDVVDLAPSRAGLDHARSYLTIVRDCGPDRPSVNPGCRRTLQRGPDQRRLERKPQPGGGDERGDAAGSVLVAIANQTLPGKTATRRAALAGPAQRARRIKPAAHTSSAMPEIAMIAPGAGRNGGIERRVRRRAGPGGGRRTRRRAPPRTSGAKRRSVVMARL